MIGKFVELGSCAPGDLIRFRHEAGAVYGIKIDPFDGQNILVLTGGTFNLINKNSALRVLSYHHSFEIQENLEASDMLAEYLAGDKGSILLSGPQYPEGQLWAVFDQDMVFIDLRNDTGLRLYNPSGIWIKKWSLLLPRPGQDPITVVSK